MPGTLELVALVALGLVPFIIGALALWRRADRRAERQAWQRLAGHETGPAEPFDPARVAELPEPARRFFAFTIAPGTPLTRTVVVTMDGEIGLGTQAAPGYRPMHALQLLAPPEGLVWRLKAGAIAGSDVQLPEGSWTRFWLAGLLPVVRVGGNADHHRSAFGRAVAESVFWAPAALLPGPGVTWQAVDADTARVTLRSGPWVQPVDITVGADGRPLRVVMPRWSNVNADKTWREQPFGGDLDGFRDFGGYRLPTVVDGGNHIGTDAYFPFYRARVRDIALGREAAEAALSRRADRRT